MRSLRDKVLRSIHNRKRKGFSRLDIRRDSGASSRYIYEIVLGMINDGTLEEYKVEGNVKFFRCPIKKTQQKQVASADEQYILILIYTKY